MHHEFIRDYTIQRDPVGYYELVIGTRQCPRTNAYNGELERLDVTTLAKVTLAFDYFEFDPSFDGVTQEQRDEWWAFFNEIKVIDL